MASSPWTPDSIKVFAVSPSSVRREIVRAVFTEYPVNYKVEKSAFIGAPAP